MASSMARMPFIARRHLNVHAGACLPQFMRFSGEKRILLPRPGGGWHARLRPASCAMSNCAVAPGAVQKTRASSATIAARMCAVDGDDLLRLRRALVRSSARRRALHFTHARAEVKVPQNHVAQISRIRTTTH
jgi:hypothetical protein